MQPRMRSRLVNSAGAAALLLVAGCGDTTQPPPPTGVPPSEARASVSPTRALAALPIGTVDGAPLGYLEYLPPGYGDGGLRPLLVFLHGSGENGDGSEAALARVSKLGIPELIQAGVWPEDRPFVVLMPQYGPERAEGDCDLATDVHGFLDFAMEHYEVDPERVYLTGISCGAIGIWDYLGAHTNEAVAAAVPIAGHAERAFEEAGCALGQVPVWAFHGAVDEIVPTVHIQGPMDRIRACRSPVPAEMQLTVYPDADHDSWTRTYDLSAGHDIYGWLLDHRRG